MWSCFKTATGKLKCCHCQGREREFALLFCSLIEECESVMSEGDGLDFLSPGEVIASSGYPAAQQKLSCAIPLPGSFGIWRLLY